MDVYVATDSYHRLGAAVWLKYTPYFKVKTVSDTPATIPVFSGRSGQWKEISHINNHFEPIKTQSLCRRPICSCCYIIFVKYNA